MDTILYYSLKSSQQNKRKSEAISPQSPRIQIRGIHCPGWSSISFFQFTARIFPFLGRGFWLKLSRDLRPRIQHRIRTSQFYEAELLLTLRSLNSRCSSIKVATVYIIHLGGNMPIKPFVPCNKSCSMGICTVLLPKDQQLGALRG